MNSDICSLISSELECEESAVAYSEAECGRDAGEEVFVGARRPEARRSQLARPVLNEPGLQTWLSKAEETALFVKRLYRTSC
jgi:hypothetical protein